MDQNSSQPTQSYVNQQSNDLKIQIERPIYYSNEFLTDRRSDGTLKHPKKRTKSLSKSSSSNNNGTLNNNTLSKHSTNSNGSNAGDTVTSVAEISDGKHSSENGSKGILVGDDEESYEKEHKSGVSLTIKRRFNTFLVNKYHNFDLSSTILYLFPIVSWLPKSLAPSDLLADLIAGLTILALQIPQGLAYARLAGVEPVHGLSVSLFTPVLYTLFGKSRHISIGTYAVVSIVCKDVLERMQHLHNLVDSDKDPVDGTVFETLGSESVGDASVRPIDILVSLSLFVGVIQLFMSCFRLGVLGSLLSDNIISGFCVASAFHALTSQCYGSLGVSSDDIDNELKVNSEVIRSWYRIFVRIPESNIATVIMSVCTLATLVGCKYLFEPWIQRRIKKNITIPIELLAIISLTAIAFIFKLEDKHGMEMVPKIVFDFQSLPYYPRVDLWPQMIPEAILMTFITYVGVFSLGKVYADKHDYTLDANQELYALGMTNTLSSFLFCFPTSASLSRSTVQDKVGGKTQIAALVSSAMMLVFILYLSTYLETLPKCALSAIIIVALISSLMKVTEALVYWRQNPLDGIMYVLTILLVGFIGVDTGLVIALLLSVAVLIYRLAFPSLKVKGQFLNSECYVSLSDYQKTCYQECANIVIFDFAGPLFYLNSNSFQSNFAEQVKSRIAKSPHIKAVVFDCSSLSYIDSAGVKTLKEIQKELNSVRLLLASVSPTILRQLIAFDFKNHLGERRIFLSVHDAVCSEM